MRRQVQARGEGEGARPAAAPAFAFILLACCTILVAACGASLNNEFTALDPPKGQQPSGLSAKASGDPKLLARSADKLTTAATPGSTGYKIGPLDVVEFSVFKVPELTRVAQVAETGTINLPLVGEVQAVGRTAQEVERELE
ncbi:MAG: polysaccharide biosynthesis/export family protein, partial [Solimonas sp.]